jgi:hypothetical protein
MKNMNQNNSDDFQRQQQERDNYYANNSSFVYPNQDSSWQAGNSNNSFAIASLILGIFSVVCCCTSFPNLAMGIAAIILAVVSKKRSGNVLSGLALAGLILGIFGTLLGLASTVFLILYTLRSLTIVGNDYFFESDPYAEFF